MSKRTDVRFMIDMKYLDTHAIRELSYNYGMMFGSKEDRKEFFRRVQYHPNDIPYGAALSHARATNLGVWGDNDALYKDCVRIMAAELCRLEFQLGRRLNITEEEIAQSRIFREAYNIMRMPKEAAINNLVRSLGRNSEDLPIEGVMMDRSTINNLHNLYNKLVNDILNQRPFGIQRRNY
jgi:hypothetical protein